MCIKKESFLCYFPYVLQPTLSPHIASRILFAFTVNPLRISAFVTVVDMEQPPRRWVAGKDADEGIVAKGQQLIADATAFPELSITLGHDE